MCMNMLKTGDRVIVKGTNDYSIGRASIAEISDGFFFCKGTDKPYYNIGPGTIVNIYEDCFFINYDYWGNFWTNIERVSGIIILCS